MICQGIVREMSGNFGPTQMWQPCVFLRLSTEHSGPAPGMFWSCGAMGTSRMETLKYKCGWKVFGETVSPPRRVELPGGE